jgi:hypothetical protein
MILHLASLALRGLGGHDCGECRRTFTSLTPTLLHHHGTQLGDAGRRP